MSTVEGGGGETYFPRALNSDGVEYTPWNGTGNQKLEPSCRKTWLYFFLMNLSDFEIDGSTIFGSVPYTHVQMFVYETPV